MTAYFMKARKKLALTGPAFAALPQIFWLFGANEVALTSGLQVLYFCTALRSGTPRAMLFRYRSCLLCAPRVVYDPVS